LVIEDDPALRLLCRVNLELEGFTVREAASIGAGREAVADERPAVVFLDINLGGFSSDELLDELRAQGIPVVLVSGTTDPEKYRGRATEVMGKPFEPSALVAAAKRYVG
jgi:DNA-binding response OmpR family regulator